IARTTHCDARNGRRRRSGERGPERGPMKAPGHVSLVGAGPGDPALLTRKAAIALRKADLVLYDALVDERVVALARRAQRFYVGKRAGRHALTQHEIQAVLVSQAKRGRKVVRLKGGDPFVFGRGGEEAQALAHAGIPFEVVPGVTAGVAAPAYAGIPVTHREDSSAVAFITAHEDPSKEETALDWAALADFPGTLVFYMGVRTLEAVAGRLIENGRGPEEPAAVIERGTLPGQRVVAGTL